MTEKKEQTVTINNTPYKLADLNDKAKNQLMNIKITDQEIERLKQQMAIAQTARNAYGKALDAALPGAEKASVQ